MSSQFQELKFWSVILGGPASRLSMTDDLGQEFFVVIPRENGKAWRDKKVAVLDLIEDAIMLGRMPGEVAISEGELRKAMRGRQVAA